MTIQLRVVGAILKNVLYIIVDYTAEVEEPFLNMCVLYIIVDYTAEWRSHFKTCVSLYIIVDYTAEVVEPF